MEKRDRRPVVCKTGSQGPPTTALSNRFADINVLGNRTQKKPQDMPSVFVGKITETERPCNCRHGAPRPIAAATKLRSARAGWNAARLFDDGPRGVGGRGGGGGLRNAIPLYDEVWRPAIKPRRISHPGGVGRSIRGGNDEKHRSGSIKYQMTIAKKRPCQGILEGALRIHR